ncbi:pantoate--beta-alanine ligase [Marinobacter lutaoensis]|jgi:pantoate--beta-alanine ligase|uniref:Pantothenate synthetase n=1 Tax=Marinobacter lutaoensis TaxID=135739 RepID=A0A1V2DPB8_9GAMM|nr:pantoate--beta-alanine ligase [Marinobacter lutaoensis]MBE02494.1 pantoate--beta-alanine ligase [Marinobacter sp.]MBI43515.1 pantoate--beta-alanine ligase [Oceanospirillales bacterium]NVD36058.1 pantoate--beta-alanine ligase [Marinobacter lutaoensis]ONF42359.1 pantoate--beta-alanine ligase [Marinobacter lutaoensis]|tara:strand:+ start:1368 stop:2216 length:849 start_codon:yes stop_codon:yes gene_type:complete
MRTVHSLKELRTILRGYRQQGKTIGLVPTMGNLHEGHISLVRKAAESADVVVTSIFVNPMQFGAHEDLDKYPRTLAEDQEKLAEAGNTLVFAPPVEEVYPEGLARQTKVVVPEVSEGHCGASRPGHFEGVATVVTMLFNMVQPDLAVFGEKDFQQLAVIRKLVRDLRIPVEIIGAPTVREDDGLAKSSRNGYLSETERRIAPRLYQIMRETADRIQQGRTDYPALEQEASAALAEAGFRPDYVNIVNSVTLKPAAPDDPEITLLVAAFLGTTRLIDNLSLTR